MGAATGKSESRTRERGRDTIGPIKDMVDTWAASMKNRDGNRA